MRLETFKELTRLEHSLFGLPFILAGASLAFYQPFSFKEWSHLFWVPAAFFMARIAGMSLNQLIDQKIDRQNPRTQHRAIPTGRATPEQAKWIALISLLVFFLICLQINALCALLAPIAIALIVSYSYLKRFSALCHFSLGLIHFLGPLMAAIALSGQWNWPACFLGLVACLKISADDMIYSLQDLDFDKQNRLHSIPVRLGIASTLRFSYSLHLLSLVAAIAVGYAARLPLFYYLLIPCLFVIFQNFHKNVRKQIKEKGSPRGIESIFFFSNAASSCLIGFFIFLSILWRAIL